MLRLPCRHTSTDGEDVGILWLRVSNILGLAESSRRLPGWPIGTMLPIWKQLLLDLDTLMDGEIFLGCPAELADRDPINHSRLLPSLTGTRPNEDLQVKGSVQASSAPYTHPLTIGEHI